MVPESLLAKLDTLPTTPGVYLFKDQKGTVVYVGKAKSLRSRVRSYFQQSSGDERYFIPILQCTAADLETVVTSSEKEAAILEDTLIKEHRPKYNIKLRDDKSYLCLRIDTHHAWPRVEVVRRPSPDGARYFGPYHSATSARRTLHLVNKHFQLRTCTDQDLENRRRPCLQYQIKRCLAPCVYEVDRAWYEGQVHAVGLFLDGRHDELSEELGERMRKASQELHFELAATYRDQLRAVDAIRQEQRVVAIKDVDEDVVGLYREGDLVQITVLYIRAGKVREQNSFPVRGVEIPDSEVIAAFLGQHYAHSGSLIPDQIVLPVLPDGSAGISEWLSEVRGKRCDLCFPQRGGRADLLKMANDNAAHTFREQRRSEGDVEERLLQVQKRLRLPTLPRRIECCDISHLAGGDTVGAIVALLDGVPDKKRYRTFNVRNVAPGDDYGAMFQVLARRFRRGKAAQRAQPPDLESAGLASEGREVHLERAVHLERGTASEWDLPDLFVVDGGRGQLNVALTAARDLGLHELTIVGLAKERPLPGWTPAHLEGLAGVVEDAEKRADEAAPTASPDGAGELRELHSAPLASDKRTPRKSKAAKLLEQEGLVDRVYLPGQKNGIPLQANSSSLFFLARARDEAHRFSNRARERLGKARRFRSELDDIVGIGPATRTALLRGLGSLAAIKRANDEQILAVPGITQRALRALRIHYPAPSAKEAESEASAVLLAPDAPAAPAIEVGK